MKKVFLLFFLVVAVYADGVYRLSNFGGKHDLTQFMSYTFEDANNTYDVWKIKNSTELKHLTKSNFGHKYYGMWTKLEIQNDTINSHSLVLSNIRAGMDKLDVYILRADGKMQTFLLGDTRPISNRPLRSRHSVVPLDIAPNESVLIITRAEGVGTLEVGWEISDTNNLLDSSNDDSIIYGLFGGLLVTLVLYNLNLFLLLKDRAILYYILYTSFILLHQYLIGSVFYELDIFNEHFLNDITFSTGYANVLFIILLSMSFFNTKAKSPKIYRVLFVLAGITSLLLALHLIFVHTYYFHIIANIGQAVNVLIFIVLFFIGVHFFRKNATGALYYLAGQSAVFIFASYQTSVFSGLFQTNTIAIYAVIIGATLDAFFLSLAISNKVKELKKQKEYNDKIIVLTSRYASMGQVVGNIAHQWKLPLVKLGSLMMEAESRILSNSKTLKEDIDSIIPKMRSTLRFMQDTISEFGNFYKADSEKILFVVSKKIVEIKELLAGKSISLNAKIEIDESCNMECFGYKNAFTQVVMIIIDNALDIAKAREIKQPIVTTYAQKDGKYLLVKIEDNCGGIRYSPASQIFESFTSDEKNGCGMGLAIAKKLVEDRLGGTVSVENTDNGARFTIRLMLETA